LHAGGHSVGTRHAAARATTVASLSAVFGITDHGPALSFSFITQLLAAFRGKALNGVAFLDTALLANVIPDRLAA